MWKCTMQFCAVPENHVPQMTFFMWWAKVWKAHKKSQRYRVYSIVYSIDPWTILHCWFLLGGSLLMGKQLKKAEKVQLVKIGENPFESGKCWKQKAISSFYQSGLRIFVRAPEVSFCCTWKFGQKHPSLRAAAQSNIYGFITLICFGLSMWIHLSFLQTYFFLHFYTRYNEKKKTYNWILMIYTLKRRNAATKVVILFLVIQSNTVSYILKMTLMKKYTKMVEVMELLIRHYFDI